MAASEETVTSKEETHHVCPWMVAYLFDNPLRRMVDPARRRLSPYVRPGMHVMDFGCGFGHYTLGMAQLTGPGGKVWAADVQEQMLKKTMKRVRKRGLEGIVTPVKCSHDGIHQALSLDFLLAGNALHETPSPRVQLAEFFDLLKPGGLFLLLEPRGHLKGEAFKAEVQQAVDVGFTHQTDGDPWTRRQYIALFSKGHE